MRLETNELNELEELISSAVNENNDTSPDAKLINTKLQEALELIRDLLEDNEEVERCD